MNRLDEVARDIVALLERLDLPYALIGGFAIRIYAIPRSTVDVDIAVAIPREQLPRLYAEVEDLGLTVPAVHLDGWVDAVAGMPLVKFKLFAEGQSIDVDVFLAETALQQSAMQRRKKHGANGWHAWFVSPEDLILLKLLSARGRDLIDIADILLVQGTLDEAYMRAWADKLGIRDRLELALEDAGKSSRE